MKSQDFGQMLRVLLKENSHTVRSFAKLAGYSSAYIGLILKGTRTPPPDQLAKWAMWLHVPRGAQRQEFISRGHAARVSAKVDCRDIVAQMKATIEELQDSQGAVKLTLDALLLQMSQGVAVERKG